MSGVAILTVLWYYSAITKRATVSGKSRRTYACDRTPYKSGVILSELDQGFQALIESSKEAARQKQAMRHALNEAVQSASPRAKIKRTEHRLAMTAARKDTRRARLSALRSDRKYRRPKKCSKVTIYGHCRVPRTPPVRLVPSEEQDAA